MKLAVFSKIGNHLPADDLCAVLADHGYQGVEWQVHAEGHISPNDVEAGADRAAAAARRRGIESICLAGYLRLGDDGAVDAIARQVAAAARIGCPAVRIWAPSSRGATPYAALFGRAHADLAAAAEVAGAHGVRLVVEVHFGTIVPSASLTLRLIDGLDPRHVGAIYDPDNLTQEGLEHWRLGLELLGPYLAYVQFKNARWVQVDEPGADGWRRWRREYVALEQGLVDWPAFLGVLCGRGYDGYLSNEDTRPVPLEERLDAGRTTITRLWAAGAPPAEDGRGAVGLAGSANRAGGAGGADRTATKNTVRGM